MDIRAVFARNLRRLRNESGMTQEQLAFAAEMDRTYISSLERGVYSATITMVAKLAEVFGVEPASMLERGVKAGRKKG